MKNKTLVILSLLVSLWACKINKKASMPIENFMMDEVLVQPKNEIPVKYQPMPTQHIDVLHTSLHLSFDYQKQWVIGSAQILWKPYSQTISHLELDAKGFEIKRVALLRSKDTSNLSYTYNGKKIFIELGFGLNPKDSARLWIDYIAKPNELKGEGGMAITDSRGLYFINPLGTDPNKPRQIWTQGETEYNSCWFPCVDLPHEKHTQDIWLSVDSADVTLSNGLLKSSKHLKNGKRVDHWQQLKPHAVYLTMIAVGNFTITKDTWRGKEVSYYLEPDYAPYARLIFGKTPQMLEAFSSLTGVPYPWDKFSQVVCRDFVSGAMENTSAVVHYENVQHNTREHLDNPQEDIIAHELFHHWFGDLVTCKTWSQLPLNESFATYGEYLYNEYAYGKTYADKVFSKNWAAYLRNSQKHFVNPVRYHYAQPDDMFDVVSYQKGSWILHHLRHTIGDSAFFKGMNIYLTRNAFKTTDIHHLRHAMEEASGKDLHLFFKQWWEGMGHPVLLNNLFYKAEEDAWYVEVLQQQDSAFGLFTLETELAYIMEGEQEGTLHHYTMPITISKKRNEYKIPTPMVGTFKPRVASFYLDPKGNLPAELVDLKLSHAYLVQLYMANSYRAKMDALDAFAYIDYQENKTLLRDAIRYCLQSKEEFYKQAGLKLLGFHDSLYTYFEKDIIALTQEAKESYLREEAYYWVAEMSKWDLAEPIIKRGLRDSSYAVVSTCLQALFSNSVDEGIIACAEFETVPSAQLQRKIAY
ncbi:MAG: M1 family metallopeptidase, partial [Bacteroidia bacterium]|nr:M1 family metallopeptidase [Bacteroidia bacterium]